MNKPNTIESVLPLSGQYSLKKDLRLNAWLAVAAAFYVLSLTLLRRHPEWSVPSRAAISLSPLFPGLLYIRSCMRFVRGMDELQRRIQLEAWLFAVMGAVFIETTINVLNANGVSLGHFKDGLGIGAAFTLTFLLWIVGTTVANCRYK